MYLDNSIILVECNQDRKIILVKGGGTVGKRGNYNGDNHAWW